MSRRVRVARTRNEAHIACMYVEDDATKDVPYVVYGHPYEAGIPLARFADPSDALSWAYGRQARTGGMVHVVEPYPVDILTDPPK